MLDWLASCYVDAMHAEAYGSVNKELLPIT